MCSRSWIHLPVLNMRDRGLYFASLVSSLASVSRSVGGSEEMLMVLGSVKGHVVWSISEMRWSSVCRGEKWGSSKGVMGLLLDGLGGVMREENLGGGGIGIFEVLWCVVGRG